MNNVKSIIISLKTNPWAWVWRGLSSLGHTCVLWLAARQIFLVRSWKIGRIFSHAFLVEWRPDPKCIVRTSWFLERHILKFRIGGFLNIMSKASSFIILKGRIFTKTPYISAERVLVPAEHFWRNVSWSSDPCFSSFSHFGLDRPRYSQISNLKK